MKKKFPLIKQVEIQGIAAEGKCIAKYDGKVVFVAGNLVAPGDIVDLQIIRKKKSYLEAVPTHFHHYSALRTEPFCSHFGTCGGCKWQHIAYQSQLLYKEQQVKDALERIAKVALPQIQNILPAQETRYYRNKLEFTFSNKRWFESLVESSAVEVQNLVRQTADSVQNLEKQISPLARVGALSEVSGNFQALGFHIPSRFDKILDIRHCYLQEHPANEIRLAIRSYALENRLEFFDLKAQTGFLRNLVIRSTSTGEWMVIVIFAEKQEENIAKVLDFLKNQFPQITSLQYIINSKKNDSYADLEPVVFSGKAFITEKMENLRFQISAKSFYQTNSKQAYQLYKVTRRFAELQGTEIVYDLYTGTGTIANFIARQARKVIGLEYIAEAVEDAKINSKINQIDNTEFFAGDIKNLLNESFLKKYGKPEVIITDPPRAGMHEDVLKMILQAEPKRIVYVSCNPATQARDLAILGEKFKVTSVQPVDMFPQTHHVENVLRLDLRQ